MKQLRTLINGFYESDGEANKKLIIFYIFLSVRTLETIFCASVMKILVRSYIYQCMATIAFLIEFRNINIFLNLPTFQYIFTSLF